MLYTSRSVWSPAPVPLLVKSYREQSDCKLRPLSQSLRAIFPQQTSAAALYDQLSTKVGDDWQQIMNVLDI